MDVIRVLIAEDMHLVRGALVALVDREPDMSVVAEASDGAVVVSVAWQHRPDVAVLDIAMPNVDGIDAASALNDELPECRILMLTAHGTPASLRKAMETDVGGFMLKDAPPHRLAEAIRAVSRGEKVIDPELAAFALRARDNPLTERDAELLRLAASGCGTAEIAARLHLSKGTVRNYLAAIVGKLGARNRLDAVRVAAESDWL